MNTDYIIIQLLNCTSGVLLKVVSMFVSPSYLKFREVVDADFDIETVSFDLPVPRVWIITVEENDRIEAAL